MTTLTLKSTTTINTELLKSIQSQNEYIIQLLKEQNKLLKQNNKPKNGKSRHEIVDSIFKEFAPGNNYETMCKLTKFCSGWKKSELDKIYAKLITLGLSSRHLKTFWKLTKTAK